MVRLLFIVNLLFHLNLYLFLTIWFLIIVSCSFRAVLQPFDTVRRTPLTQWERRTKSVSRNRVNILAPSSISPYSCGTLPLHYIDYGPRRQRSWPVNIHYVMFSHVRFRVGRDAALGTDRRSTSGAPTTGRITKTKGIGKEFRLP